MDLNRDELRRQLRDIDQANTAFMPKFRDAIHRFVNPESKLTNEEKAAVLGVPGRRQFFKVGGVTILGAALLAACGDDDEDTAETGDGDDEAGEGPTEMDVVLGRTAASIEALAVAAYTAGIDSGAVTNPAIGDAAGLFRGHHQEHLDALNGVLTQNGAEAVTDPNQVLFDAVVKPVVDAGLTEASIVGLAYDLEKTAVRAYAFAGGAVSIAGLRSTLLTIGGIESRHAAILKMVAQAAPPAEVFYDGAFIQAADAGIPEAALIS